MLLYLLLILVLTIAVLAIIIKTALWKKARGYIYLAVDCYCRNCAEESFYVPSIHEHFSEYRKEYVYLRSKVNKWYFSDSQKQIISSFLRLYEKCDDFIHEMSKYMGNDHYYAHSEFTSVIEKFSFKDDFKQFITDGFLDFVNKNVPKSFLRQEDYISNLDAIHTVPQKHNDKFVKDELITNKVYFDTVLKYPLDSQQRNSIVKLEDNCLVVSSAGSGKTSTTVGKIKYLVERRGIQPSRILPLTFTRKAAEELTERLGYKEKGLYCHTFHSLAFQIIAQAKEEKPNVCEANIWLRCFYNLVNNNNTFRDSINKYLIEYSSLTKDEFEYQSAEEYYKDRSLYGIMAPFLDMNGNIIFTKSEQEKKICTFLSLNGIQFRYEQAYFKDTYTEHRRQYKPDFTIYSDKGFVILEHFGVDRNGNVPSWFGTGVPGGYSQANKEYNEGIIWKRFINKKYNVPLLETTSAMFDDGTVFECIKEQLLRYGISLRPLSEEEKFNKLVKRNPRMEGAILQLISTFITLAKSNRSTPSIVLEKIKQENKDPRFVERSQFLVDNILTPMYENYEKMLKDEKQIDYTDLIIKATDICKQGLYNKQYDFILVDEFQDISIDRFELIQAIRTPRPLTKLYAVGDDWQSIFRFSGSDLSLFSDFEKYFGFTEKCKIESTYRFSNPLLRLSSEFILRNPLQVTKNIRPAKMSFTTDLKFKSFDPDNKDSQFEEVKSCLMDSEDSESVMLVARYHRDFDFIPSSNVLEKDNKGNITKIKINNKDISCNTIHSAKGLEADIIILVNCSQDGNGFPSKVSDDPILGYVLSQPETYPFSEERRLFYVAVTRAKRKAYVLYKNSCPSPFISEFTHNSNNMICPLCKNGTLRNIKEGETYHGKWRLYLCSNNTAACRFKWFVNYDNEQDIKIQFNKLKK